MHILMVILSVLAVAVMAMVVLGCMFSGVRRFMPGVMAICCLLTLVAMAAVPVTKTLTLPGGGTGTNVATWVYSTGENRSANSAYQIEHFILNLTSVIVDPVSTYTVYRVKGSYTNQIYQFTAATNTASQVVSVTNKFWILRDETLRVTSSTTNAGTLDVTVLEQ